MSEELLQRDLNRKNPTSKIGKWDYFSIGSTSIKALKEAGIIRNVNYGSLEWKKVDGIIIDNKNVIAVIEFKQPKEFRTKKQKNKAIAQEIEVAKILGSKIIIATDSEDAIWVNVLTGQEIRNEEGKNITTRFNPSDEHLPMLIEKINSSINEKNNQILPPNLINPTDLAKSIWQDIWSVSGATPENCLYTFVELFIFKYLSDLGILKNRHGFDFLLGMESTDTSEEILGYYAREIRTQIKKLFPYNPIDNTTIINGTIFVSKDQHAVAGYSTVFIKVLKKFRDYGRLENIDYDFKSKLFESFLKESISKKNWGQFFTPMKVIHAVETMAKDEIKEGSVICDPACGVGKFLLEPIKSKLSQFYTVSGESVQSNITIKGFDKGFDKDEQKTIILAKANMLIYFSEIIKDHPNHTIEFGKIFNESFTLKTNSILGTLRDPVENEYDLILTNPPYVTSGSSNLKEEISKVKELKSYYKINGIGVEGLFMEWIVRALKPGGKAFIVVPDGIFNRVNDKNLREFIKAECFIDGIISLPENTFFTTPKKTYILCVTKKNRKSDIQENPVFTYLVSEIGESRDIYRFDIEQNDLNEAAIMYNFFKGNKSNFEKFNSDPRCKIFSIDKFESDSQWAIEKWWSNEEKIQLGIEDEVKFVDFDEVPSLFEEAANVLNGIGSMIKELEQDDLIMSKLTFKEFKVGDIFDLPSIKGITKSFIEQNKGQIPVYGGKITEEAVGYVADQLNGVKYFEDCLAWNREGSVGYVFWHKHKFTTNDHHRPILVKSEYKDLIDLSYIKYELQKVLMAQGFKWSQTASKEKVNNLFIKIPVSEEGTFDVLGQDVLAKRYLMIEQAKASIKNELNKINSINISI